MSGCSCLENPLVLETSDTSHCRAPFHFKISDTSHCRAPFHFKILLSPTVLEHQASEGRLAKGLKLLLAKLKTLTKKPV
jgi:hypothetical protein